MLPVTEAAIKPATAPTSIIPSTPRFNTPDFLVTNSPSAAKIRGVADRRVSLMIKQIVWMFTLCNRR